MLKTLVTATAIGGLMLSAAMAQTTSPTPPTATPAPSTTPAPRAAVPADKAQFIAAQKADQWLASKFNGTDVLGPDNAKIGDVNDILFDKDGKVVAVIVGVGGFLGIGQKDVALELAAFQMVPASMTSANTGSAAANRDDPHDVKLKLAMTKDDLKAAPAFERYKAARTTSTIPPANTGQRPTGGLVR